MNHEHHFREVRLSSIAGWGTILIVEDDAGVRSLTRMMLGKLGYDVLTAHDGAEAVETFETYAHRIRLVISDLEMPRLGGWGLLAAIRRQRPELPVVLTSGHDLSDAIAACCDELPPLALSKPYTLESLRQVLETALSGALQYPFCPNQSKADLSRRQKVKGGSTKAIQ